jgi:hypothetical protein
VYYIGFINGTNKKGDIRHYNELTTQEKIDEITKLDKNLKEFNLLSSNMDTLKVKSTMYSDSAAFEMMNYVMKYNDKPSKELPDYYVSGFGDSIKYNKENFFYYTALFKMNNYLGKSRKTIIDGFIVNDINTR